MTSHHGRSEVVLQCRYGRASSPSHGYPWWICCGFHSVSHAKRPLTWLCLSVAVTLLGSLGLAACGSSTGSGGSGPINIANIMPFSGPLASYGPFTQVPCDAATYAINRAGGVLGRKMTCIGVDDTGDSADAVPNVARALATKHFDMAVGFETATAAVTLPITSSAHITSFVLGGVNSFDTETSPYFWRTLPPDAAQGTAFMVWASRLHLNRVAVVLAKGNSTASYLPGIVSAAMKLGIILTTNLSIQGGAASYGSIVSRVVATRPQALIFDSDPQTAATFFGDYSQQTGNTIPPVIADSAMEQGDTFNAIAKVIGASTLASRFTYIGSLGDTNGDGYKAYTSAVKAGCQCSTELQNQVIASAQLAASYDDVILAALAMTVAHSTNPEVYNSDIPEVLQQTPDAVVIHTYADALAALKAGKKIDFVGAEGQITFDRYHNSPGAFSASVFTASAQAQTSGIISQAALEQAR